MNFLDFEQPIADLEAKIKELRYIANSKELNISEEIDRLQKKSVAQTEAIFSSLTPWQVTQLARHPGRPYTLDYIKRIINGFEELHGGCNVADDPAIICGIGELDGYSVAIIGHQKGRDTKQRIYRNYGMPRPEGYRKALRTLKLAERFQLPVISFIDTPGAYPGVEAEERGQSEAIAANLMLMSELKTAIIAVVIGEGGSGGALAIGVSDYLYMLQYSTYSVISPEGCASILWKNAEKTKDAARIMGITADRLKKTGLIDAIIDEPLGGAHRDFDMAASKLKKALVEKLVVLTKQDITQTVSNRKKKLRGIGRYRLD